MTKIQEQEIRNCRKNVKYDAFLNQSHRPGSSLNETRMSWRWPSASPRIAGTLYPNQSGGYTKWWSSSSALAVPFLYCWKQTCHSERQQLNHHHAARQTRWLKEDVPSAFSCVWAEHHSDTGVTEASWRGPTRCSAEPPALTNSVTYGQPQPPIPWGCCALIRGGGGGGGLVLALGDLLCRDINKLLLKVSPSPGGLRPTHCSFCLLLMIVCFVHRLFNKKPNTRNFTLYEYLLRGKKRSNAFDFHPELPGGVIFS